LASFILNQQNSFPQTYFVGKEFSLILSDMKKNSLICYLEYLITFVGYLEVTVFKKRQKKASQIERLYIIHLS
jgi:hypothetical protein